ncbi:SDR family NAD(P)-dependent oxidoreductase [Bradyrhizobium canariense]|uniref:2-hydroxycyclohexanecarboxyl-CoA dehydrogenase n=1 Tax=Bradyrhizobium canariense TaxID=255045 RepID=A0A1H1SFJ7_9BRAD|nr:SDR family NAD(P)-dependent oxidoreductase [Bradyrhizobium canariense]SDS46722.1 2-hydroxycyclohexanecarboxyl-CoA dehydrogenase [Bradyrhizobium canariense]
MKFKDEIVVITGAASGIGLATARAFAEVGARVVLTDVNVAAGEKAASELKSVGDTRFMALDVTDRASAEVLAARIESELGRLDVLVNAAGWDIIEPFMNNPPEYWAKIVALNFMGPVQVTRALLPLLFASGSGRIVNVSSDAGRVGSYGEAVYAGAKGGIIAFTKSLAREVVRKNVRANCVCPGPTDTPLFASQSEKMREALVNAIPMKRVAQPSEIADAILFFASDRSRFVTGQVLSVSGGLTMVD